MKINKTLLAVAVSLAVAGCNSNSSRDDITIPEEPPVLAPELTQGAFYDAPTNGLWFSTIATNEEGVDIAISGFTGEAFDSGDGTDQESLYDGSFGYMEIAADDSPNMIEFRLGGADGLLLGRARGPVRFDAFQEDVLNGRHVMPHNLTADPAYNLNIARLLLTIDQSDAVNQENKNPLVIQIPDDFKEAGEKLAKIDLGRLNDVDLAIINGINDGSIEAFVSADDAIAHLTKTKARVEEENADLKTPGAYNPLNKKIITDIIRHRGDDGEICALDLTADETSDLYIAHEIAEYQSNGIAWQPGSIDPFDPGKGFDGELLRATSSRETDIEARDRDSWTGGCQASEDTRLGEERRLGRYPGLTVEDHFSNEQFPDRPVSYQNYHGLDRGYMSCGAAKETSKPCNPSELNGFWTRGFNYANYRLDNADESNGQFISLMNHDAPGIFHPNNPEVEVEGVAFGYAGPIEWGNKRWEPTDRAITEPDVFMGYSRYRIDQISRQFLPDLELMVEDIKSKPLTEGIHGDPAQLGKVYTTYRWANAQNPDDPKHGRNIWLPYDQSQSEELRFYFEEGTTAGNSIDMTGDWQAGECVYSVSAENVTVDGDECLSNLHKEMFWLSESEESTATLAQLNMRVKLNDSGYVRWSYLPGSEMQDGTLYRFEENNEGEVTNTTALTRASE